MIDGSRLFSALPLSLLAQEAEEHASTFLGLPLWLWQLANLAAFLGVLLYFVARPLAAMFRNRQLAVEERLREAKAQRAEAQRLAGEVRDRMARLDEEIAEIHARGVAEGEAERAALTEKADLEVERVRREAEQEIGRHLAAAKLELRRTAAHLTAGAAREMLSAQITEEDRRRLLEEGVSRLAEKPSEESVR
ncbi:MAG TPA: ATP synthase F0 subunit B [Thermoanaerobaculia bacterium]